MILAKQIKLSIEHDNHNIYDNLAVQLLISKLNIENQVISCKIVNEAIKYSNNVLIAINYHEIETLIQELSNSQMKNIIRTYTALSQFITSGCTIISLTGFSFTQNFEIFYHFHLASFLIKSAVRWNW
jgi:hypothetical protein